MKIFILNSSGNVGKSLISRELFYPRLDNCKIIEVETVNRGSKELKHLNVEQFKTGDDFMNIYLQLMEIENIIVDVGASNLAGFWEQMNDYTGIEDMFDLFVIPVTSGDKEMTDTYKTILFLREQGIPEEKIKVIFNRVKKSVENEFAVLLSADFSFNTNCFIKESSLFKDLGLMKQTISDIYNEDIDSYKKQILEEKSPQKKLLLVKKDLANRMAVKIKRDFDELVSCLTDYEPKQEPREQKKKEKVQEVKEVEKETENEISEDDEEL